MSKVTTSCHVGLPRYVWTRSVHKAYMYQQPHMSYTEPVTGYMQHM